MSNHLRRATTFGISHGLLIAGSIVVAYTNELHSKFERNCFLSAFEKEKAYKLAITNISLRSLSKFDRNWKSSFYGNKAVNIVNDDTRP